MALSSGTVWKFSTSSFTVLCLGVLAEASAGEPGAPQAIDVTSLVYTGCGTGSAHNTCTLTSTASEGNPDEAALLATAANLGGLEVTDEGAAIEFECPSVGISECKYSFAGQSLHVEGATEANHGMLNPEAIPLEKTSGGFLCPETTEVTGGLLEPLEDTYIAQGQGNPGIKFSLDKPDDDLFTEGQVRTVTITNQRNNDIKLIGEGFFGPFEGSGKNCNEETLKKNGGTCKRDVKCKDNKIGDGAFTVAAEEPKKPIILAELKLKCDKK
jgi:hypothetical protein